MPSVLGMIRAASGGAMVGERRDGTISPASTTPTTTTNTTTTTTGKKIHVIAYSANPALAPSVVDECLSAGAIGVLQPPYDSVHTVQTIRRMVRWAERRDEVRRSFDLAGFGAVGAGAVGGGDERERAGEYVRREEEVLEEAAIAPPSPSECRAGESDVSHPTERSEDHVKTFYSRLVADDLTPRRRSVDNGGLALSIQRAGSSSGADGERSDRDELTMMPGKQDRSSSLAGLEGCAFTKQEQQGKTGRGHVHGEPTVVAELLGEMYRQTRIAIEIQMVDYPEYSAPLTREQRARLIEALSTWDFRPHDLSEPDLFRCACLLFEAVLRIKGLAELGIERDQVNRLLFAIRAIYHAPNPYHNYIHAVDVLQASYTFLVAGGVAPPPSVLLDDTVTSWERQPIADNGHAEEHNASVCTQALLRPQDVLAIMIAAMGHDVGHPGLSNVFMKNAKTPLSQVYEDKSVLENMHCMLIVQLLRKHGFSFLLEGSVLAQSKTTSNAGSMEPSPSSLVFPNIPPPTALGTSFDRDEKSGAIHDWRGFKKLVYSTVLATDMSIHFTWIKRFIDCGKRMRARPDATTFTQEEEDENRVLLCQAIIKCADISNPTRPIAVSEHWSSVLLQEWANQATLEQELQLPVSVVASADAAIQAKGQIGFIDLFTLPLFEAAADVMPNLRCYADACSTNRALWQERFDTVTKLSETAPIPPIKSPLRELNDLELSTANRYKSLFPLSLPPSVLLKTGSDGFESSPNSPVQPGIGEQALHSDTHAVRRAYLDSTTPKSASRRTFN